MRKKLERLLSVLLLTAGVSVGLYYFATGFLLARVELSARSTCADPPARTTTATSDCDGGDCCWVPRRFSRAVLLVVDALRFDFVWSNVNRTPTAAQQQQHFAGRMPVFAEMAAAERRATWFFEAWADPPTTTMQRLKGVTTGGLPTFVDVGSSFASTELAEDNLLAQAVSTAKRRATLIGDDTWKALFPRLFARDFSMPSFDVKDLHSVDAAVARRLPEELRRDDWEILIAHTLGVDHVGHRHGSDHPAMAEKLAETDRIVRAAVENLPDDAILVVMGDHGMTPDGNHGGATDHELSSALVLHYHDQLSTRTARRAAVEKAQEIAGRRAVKHSAADYRRVMQIDLVPTLSLLLGLPVPYGNVGMVLAEPFIAQQETPTLLEDAARVTAWQTWRYLSEYAKRAPGFGSRPELEKARDALKAAEKLEGTAATKEYFRAHDLMAWACRAAWATFDTEKMLWGLLVVVSFVLGLVLLAFAAPFGIDEFPLQGVLYGLLAGFTSATVMRRSSFKPIKLASTAIGGALGFISYIWRLILQSLRNKRFPWPIMLPFAVVAVRCVGLFSNSFIEADSSVVCFLLVSLVAALALMFLPSSSILPRSVWLELAGIAALVRVSAIYGSFYGRHEAYTDHPMLELIFFTLLPALLLVFAARTFIWKKRSVARVLFELSVGLACMYWAAQNPVSSAEPWAANASVIFARGAFAFAGSILLLTVGTAIATKGKRGSLTEIVAALAVVVALVSGPRAPLALVLLFFEGLMFSDIVSTVGSTWSPVLAGVAWGLVGMQFFFATGHSCLFSGIHFEAAFVGMQKAHIVLGGVLVSLNTVGMPLLAALSLPLLFPRRGRAPPRWDWLYSATLAFVLVFASATASTTAFVHFARRHLMVWRVFCPRFIFDVALMATSIVGLALSWVFCSFLHW